MADVMPDPAGAPATDRARPALVRRGIRLALLSVAWDVVAGVLAIVTGVIAGSIALVAFGIESLVETMAGGLLVWRLSGAAAGTLDEEIADELAYRAGRMIGVACLALAAYLAYQAILAVVGREAPAPSPAGIALVAISVGVLVWLSRGERHVGAALGDPALVAAGRATLTRNVFAVVALAGLLANLVVGWWWADPVAGLAIAVLLVVQALDTFRTGAASE